LFVTHASILFLHSYGRLTRSLLFGPFIRLFHTIYLKSIVFISLVLIHYYSGICVFPSKVRRIHHSLRNGQTKKTVIRH